MHDGVSVGRRYLVDAVHAWTRTVGTFVRSRLITTPNAGVSTANAVRAGETPAHEQFRIEGECSQMSRPFLALLWQSAFRHRCTPAFPPSGAAEKQDYTSNYSNHNGYGNSGLEGG